MRELFKMLLVLIAMTASIFIFITWSDDRPDRTA